MDNKIELEHGVIKNRDGSQAIIINTTDVHVEIGGQKPIPTNDKKINKQVEEIMQKIAEGL